MADLGRNHEVDRFRALALLVRLDLEGDALPLGEILQPGALHGGDVHEHVAAAVVRLDEAVAAFAVEELDRPCHGHRETSPVCFAVTRNLAFGPTGQSLPESMATLAKRGEIRGIRLAILRPCHSAATIRGSGT